MRYLNDSKANKESSLSGTTGYERHQVRSKAGKKNQVFTHNTHEMRALEGKLRQKCEYTHI